MADEEAPTSETPEIGSEKPDAEGSGAVATMTDSTPAVNPAELAAAADAHREALRTRVIIPLLLPLITAGAILVYILNLSRALLAGGKWGALAIASIVTVAILGGAALVSARPRMRTSTLVMLVSGLFVLIVAAGLTTIGPSEEKVVGATGYQQPKGAAVATLKVTALASIKFDATTYNVKAGIVEIDYIDGGGTHTLNFDSPDPKLAGFGLAVPGGPTKLKADLAPGKYTIYCNIPGHRALGMQATVIAQ